MLRAPSHYRQAMIAALLLAILVCAGGTEALAKRKIGAQAPEVAAYAGIIVTQISLKQEADRAVLVIDMSSTVRAQASVMLEPNRLLLDFPGIRFHAPQVKLTDKDGLIRDLRFGAFMQGQGRVILDLRQPLHLGEQRFLPLAEGGVRLIVELLPIPIEAFKALAHPLSDDTVTGTTPEATKADELPLVVLDPGHGGIDSGASGPSGELEKTLVLQFSLSLKERLESSGKVKVLMTRSTDVFVPLRDRVRIARQAKAALFISLHADALPEEGDVRGASIYVLSDKATDERAARLADSENRADLAAGIELRDDQDEVADILFDLARRESRAFSNQFARYLASSLPKVTRMHKNPLRGAGFRVLRAPDVPSVLLELGYLTTIEEAKLMQTEEWRRATAGAAAEAIERFLAERGSRDKDKP